MKDFIAALILLFADVITMSISLTCTLYFPIKTSIFSVYLPSSSMAYTQIVLVYGITILVFLMEGLYSKRFDLWQEYQRIVRSLLISLVIVLSTLSLQISTEMYSRFLLIGAFILMLVLFPIQKYITKRLLFKIGIWKRKAFILEIDPFFQKHVFENPHLGYIKGDKQNSKTLFITSKNLNSEEIDKLLDQSVRDKQEVLFLPILNSYDFSDSFIIHIFNAQSNLIVLKNKLLNPLNYFIKICIDYLLSFIVIIPSLVIMGIIAFLIKKNKPNSPVLFHQLRMGFNGRPFNCYKFRTMYENSDTLLENYLKNNPHEVDTYKIYHKYDNDPRITSIGKFLRKTSLDELPQILNVFRGEMSFIGPRPYMIKERHKLGSKRSLILAVKPGITGLWQVSGRNNMEFEQRVSLDAWYVRNWNLWTDFIILIKTVKVVLTQKGAN